ncbi:MAG: aspartate aminotransferase family protein [Actinobacteria bacterium]|nr:aspartate aminotransferase family protein [Actinomycetota bacterium]
MTAAFKKSGKIPDILITPPGPKSKSWHERAARHMKGYSNQVKQFPVVWESGQGNTMTDVDGNTYIDFSAGIYCNSTGHCHPKVSEKIKEYSDKLMNCHDFTTPVKTLFLEKLASLLPGSINGIQLYCGGSEAVEAALRAVRVIKGGKYEMFSFWGDWHGKTMASMSLSSLGNEAFGPRAAGCHLSPTPNCFRCPFKLKYPECGLVCMDILEGTIDNEGTGMQAAVIMELIQGYSGTVVYPDEVYSRISEICKKREMLFVVDEILTGMGRTGKMFCCENFGLVPDVITLGKGVGGGFPVSAFAVKEEYDWALEKASASTTYGGNPIACAAGLATLEVIEEENILENVNAVGAHIKKRLFKLKENHSIVGDVRGRGLLLAIDLVKGRGTNEAFVEAGKMVYEKAFSNGLAWIPAENILRLAPPLTMTEELADKAIDIIDEAITEVEKYFKIST